MIEENPLVLNPHAINTRRTICRPFRENSNLSKTTLPRKRHVSSTRRFRGKDESRHLTLEPAPARGSQSGGARGPSERADSAAPALARGVPSDCWEAPESARFARFEPELQIAPGLTMSSSGLRWYSFLERTMRAVEPPPPPQAPFEPSLEPRASPPSRRATTPGVDLAPKEARFQRAFLDWQNDSWRVGTRRLTQIRAHR